MSCTMHYTAGLFAGHLCWSYLPWTGLQQGLPLVPVQSLEGGSIGCRQYSWALNRISPFVLASIVSWTLLNDCCSSGGLLHRLWSKNFGWCLRDGLFDKQRKFFRASILQAKPILAKGLAINVSNAFALHTTYEVIWGIKILVFADLNRGLIV